MFSLTRPGHFSVPALVLSLSILTGNAIIPDTFAQTPSVAPSAGLQANPSFRAASLRARRVSGSTDGEAGPGLVEATELEKRAFELTNAARAENSLESLVWSPELCRMARMHSESMALLGFFSHVNPDGLRMTDRARALGIAHFHMLGENIAYNQGFPDPAGFAVQEWLLSPGHRANILRAEFQQSAIGVFVAANGTVYLTQEFMTR
jgi:uncharacterized protein YkwD